MNQETTAGGEAAAPKELTRKEMFLGLIHSFQAAAMQQMGKMPSPFSQQIERVKAFVVPKPGIVADRALADELIAHCRGQLIKWSCPREVEFRESLPTTRLGKIDYRALAEAEHARR